MGVIFNQIVRSAGKKALEPDPTSCPKRYIDRIRDKIQVFQINYFVPSSLIITEIYQGRCWLKLFK